MNIGNYRLESPLQNNQAGFSRWTTAHKDGKRYFLKEFLDPVYPEDASMSANMLEKRREDCTIFEQKKCRLYEGINKASEGHLVRILDFFRCDTHYYIATEHIERWEGKNVWDMEEHVRLLLCKTIAYAILNLHRQHIVHADLKEDNIIIRKSDYGQPVGKIIDFDSAFFEGEPPVYEDELGGDQVYLSPEACRFLCGEKPELSCKMDVFALGLIFHRYMTGVLPGYDNSVYDYPHEAVLDGAELQVSESIEPRFRAVIRGMLFEDPDQRVSMEEVYSVLNVLVADPHPEESVAEQAGQDAPDDSKPSEAILSEIHHDHHAAAETEVVVETEVTVKTEAAEETEAEDADESILAAPAKRSSSKKDPNSFFRQAGDL